MPDHYNDDRDFRDERDYRDDPRRSRPLGSDPMDDPRFDDRREPPLGGPVDDPRYVDPRRDPMMDRDRMDDRDRDLMDDRRTVGDHPERHHTKISDIKGKSILSLANGQRIGQVDDVLVDPHSMSIAGLIYNVGGMFDREKHIVPASNVEKWGQDAILIGEGRTFIDRSEVPDFDNWISTESSLRGLSVVTTDGDKIGTISDVLVDQQGMLTTYQVSEGSSAFGGDTFEIPAQSTRTLGKDVAIVDYRHRPHRD